MSELSLETIKSLPLSEQQDALIALFNAKNGTEQEQICAEIAEYVLDRKGSGNRSFGYAFQLYLLKWLLAHHIELYHIYREDEAQRKACLKNISSCLWIFKWIVGSLPCDLKADQEDIAQALEHMRGIYQDFNRSLAMVEKARLEQAMFMGDVQAAPRYFEAWQAAEIDDSADCEACEISSRVKYYHFIGEYEKAIEAAQPLLAGEQECSEVPHVSYAAIIGSFMQLGQFEEAKYWLDWAVAHIRKEGETFYYLLPELLQLAIPLGMKAFAEEILDELHAEIKDRVRNNHFYYFQYLMAIEPFSPKTRETIQKVAEAFDERNSNNYYQNMIRFRFADKTDNYS